MHCITTAIVASFLFVLPVSAQNKQLSIRWNGQAFFEIKTSKGTKIVIDPHAIEAFGVRDDIEADLICVSHFHTDHMQVEVVKNLTPKNAKDMILTGLKEEKGKRADWNIIEGKEFKDVKISTVGLYHDDVKGMMRGKNSAFIFEVDGFRIVHLGDLGHLLTKDQIKKIGTPDILMIPVGGVYTINGTEAKKVVEQLKPRYYILPMHYGVKGYDALLTADEFLEDEKPEYIRDELKIDVGAKAPDKPKIVMLGWERK